MDISVLFSKFADQGVLGIICGLAIYGCVALYKEVRTLMKESKEETKASTDKAWTALNAATEVQRAGNEAIKQLKEIVDAAILKGGGK